MAFPGAHAYLFPQVYLDLTRVPACNYLAVHCTVQATWIEAPSAKDGLLKKLTADHEPAYARQWQSMDNAHVQKMLSGIVASELQTTGLQCKLKLN